MNDEEYAVYRMRPLRTRPRVKTQAEAVRTAAAVVTVILQVIILIRVFGL